MDLTLQIIYVKSVHANQHIRKPLSVSSWFEASYEQIEFEARCEFSNALQLFPTTKEKEKGSSVLTQFHTVSRKFWFLWSHFDFSTTIATTNSTKQDFVPFIRSTTLLWTEADRKKKVRYFIEKGYLFLYIFPTGLLPGFCMTVPPNWAVFETPKTIQEFRETCIKLQGPVFIAKGYEWKPGSQQELFQITETSSCLSSTTNFFPDFVFLFLETSEEIKTKTKTKTETKTETKTNFQTSEQLHPRETQENTICLCLCLILCCVFLACLLPT